MTIDSKRFTRPLVLAAALAAISPIVPSAVDHGALFGVGVAMAHGHSGGSHGGRGQAGRDHASVSDHGLGMGSPRNGGPGSDPAARMDSHDISQGAPRNGGPDSDPAANPSPGTSQGAPRNGGPDSDPSPTAGK